MSTELKNFCSTCGKRLFDGSIHTCTPPAPVSAPIGEELPALPEPFDHVDMADGSIAAVFSADQYCEGQRDARKYQRKVDEKIIARRDERIRQLERELAERTQGGWIGSVGDYTQFHVLLNAVCDASEELEKAESREVFPAVDKLTAAKDALIAYIDGRTAGTTPEGYVLVPVVPTDDMIVAFAEQWYSKVRCIDDCQMEDCYAAMLAAAPSPLNSGKEEAK